MTSFSCLLGELYQALLDPKSLPWPLPYRGDHSGGGADLSSLLFLLHSSVQHRAQQAVGAQDTMG